MRNLLVQPLTVQRASTVTNRYGSVEKDWTTVTETVVNGWVSRMSQSEDPTRREAQVSEWVAYFPAGTSIHGGDRVVWQDATFEVDGPPFHAWTPRGEHHIEAPLRAVDG